MPKFKVTKNAPGDIYGKTVAADDVITLTKAQAEHHLLKGHIELHADDAAAASVEGVEEQGHVIAASSVQQDPDAFSAPVAAKTGRGKRD